MTFTRILVAYLKYYRGLPKFEIVLGINITVIEHDSGEILSSFYYIDVLQVYMVLLIKDGILENKINLRFFVIKC